MLFNKNIGILQLKVYTIFLEKLQFNAADLTYEFLVFLFSNQACCPLELK